MEMGEAAGKKRKNTGEKNFGGKMEHPNEDSEEKGFLV